MQAPAPTTSARVRRPRWRNFAALVQELSGFTGEIGRGPERLGDIFRNVSDNARARQAFGWASGWTREGLARQSRTSVLPDDLPDKLSTLEKDSVTP